MSANYIWNIVSVVIDVKKISLNPASVKLPYMDRNPDSVTDVSHIKDSSFVKWLDKNALTPEDYLVRIASSHQITLLGEEHQVQDNLLFLKRMIKPLYFKAGVRTIAMEVIPETMNKKVDLLVNNKFYDTALEMQIARGQPWKMWGLKEYWDILNEVWKLNNSLPEGAPHMRVVGIDEEWLMPNFSLLNISSDDSKGKSAFWEKFRIFSVIEDLPKIAYRDETMARNIEKEIIDKKQKAVVLIGVNHTPLNYAYPLVRGGKIVAAKPRFGVLLNKKYPGKIFQIELLARMDFNENDVSCSGSSLDNFLDSVIKKRNNQSGGFTIASSPFEKLRDSCSMYFSSYPSVCYGDIAEGLIFLKPFEQLRKCTWLKGYISDEMFMNYKPMYELMFKRNLKSAYQLDSLLFKEIAN